MVSCFAIGLVRIGSHIPTFSVSMLAVVGLFETVAVIKAIFSKETISSVALLERVTFTSKSEKKRERRQSLLWPITKCSTESTTSVGLFELGVIKEGKGSLNFGPKNKKKTEKKLVGAKSKLERQLKQERR